MTLATASAPEPIDSADDLTASWLTAALQSAGHDLTVERVTTEPIGVGQIGTNLRLHLEWTGTPGPDTFVVKLAAGDPASRDIVRLAYQKEVGFYTDIAAATDVRVPRCWFGAISSDYTVFTLVLDDLAPAVPGDQIAGCSETEASAALENLARLHAARWCDPELSSLEWLTVGGLDNTEVLGPLVVDALPTFLDRIGYLIGPVDAATLERSAHAIAAWSTTRTERFGLLHADYRLDNLMFSPSGEVTALDWQTLSIAPPLRDVAYFVETGLDVELRRACERQLVEGYRSQLVARGVRDYSVDDVWIDYRLGTLHGVLVTVLGCVYAQAEQTEHSDAMFAVMATRSCGAIRDLDPFALL